MEERNNKRKLILVVSLFAIFYSLISLVNHYCFRTYALDLGLYTNALYDYAHLKWNDSTVFKEVSENLLSDHFDIYLILFSPFSFVFGSYTLLILQIIFVLIGGIGVFKYIVIITSRNNLALWAMIYFYLFFGVISALSFDYHSNVVSASLVVWFWYFFHQQKWIKTTSMFIFILIGKENTSLWMVFVCLGMMYNYKDDKGALMKLGYFALSALVYFILIVTIVIPYLSNDSTYAHFDYDCLGIDFKSAILFLISHPIDAIKLLFINHNSTAGGDFVKLETYLLLIISGTYILFLRPQYLLMLFPIVCQKMYHNNMQMWTVITHYSIEFAPILAVGIFTSINQMSSLKSKNSLIVFIMVGVTFSTFRVMDNSIVFTDRERLRVYVPNHYKRNYDLELVHSELSKIPNEAIVSSQSPFLPHLALRDKVYQFPIIKDADFIVISFKEQPYPLNEKEFMNLSDQLINSGNWQIQFEGESLLVLRRIK